MPRNSGRRSAVARAHRATACQAAIYLLALVVGEGCTEPRAAVAWGCGTALTRRDASAGLPAFRVRGPTVDGRSVGRTASAK